MMDLGGRTLQSGQGEDGDGPSSTMKGQGFIKVVTGWGCRARC